MSTFVAAYVKPKEECDQSNQQDLICKQPALQQACDHALTELPQNLMVCQEYVPEHTVS